MAFTYVDRAASPRPSTVERAYELARSGSFAKKSDLRARLKAEGYDDYRAQISGLAIARALQRLTARPDLLEGFLRPRLAIKRQRSFTNLRLAKR